MTRASVRCHAGRRRNNATKLNSSAASHETSCSSAEDQRHNIMAHATLVNSRKRTKPSGEPADSGNLSPTAKASIAEPTSAADDEAARKAIMQHAAQLAPSNCLLAQLHAERLARQQLANPQQQDEQPKQQKVMKQEASKQIPEVKLLTYNVW